MRKKHKWLLGIGIPLVVLLGASVAVFYIGTNMMLTTLMPELEDFPLELEEDAHTDDGRAETDPPVRTETPATPDDAERNIPAVPAVPTPEQTEQPPAEDADSTPVSPTVPPSAEQSEQLEEPAAEVEEGDDNEDPFAYSADISADKQAAVQENITFGERLKLTTTLAKNLNGTEIRQFMNMAQGGLSVQDKREAKKIMLEKLSEDEYNELITIAAKYGLSQGKGYGE